MTRTRERLLIVAIGLGSAVVYGAIFKAVIS